MLQMFTSGRAKKNHWNYSEFELEEFKLGKCYWEVSSHINSIVRVKPQSHKRFSY